MTEELHQSGMNRREVLRAGAVGAMALSAAGFLAACGSGSGSTGGASPTAVSAGPPKGGKPVRGGALRIGLITAGGEENLAVPTSSSLPDLVRTQNLYDPLFFVGDHGAVQPALCTEAHANNDATVWTFRLRDGVVWHDGKPFTADDVVYTIQRSWGSSENIFNAVLKQFVDFNGVRKRDNLTVEVPLKVPIAQFPQTTCIQNTYIIQDGTTDFTHPIGTGPFVFKSFNPGSRSVFTANKNYWIEGQPYVDELIVDSSFSEPNTTMSALLSGQIDIMPAVPPALARANATTGKMNLGNQQGPGWMAPCFRVDQAPFTDKRVRQAFKYMADREAVVTSVFDGYATPGNDCPGATLQYWAGDLKREHDPEKAKALLKQAGQEGISITLEASPVLPGMVEMATIFAQQAAEAGANVKVKQVDPSVYYSTGFAQRKFSMEAFTNGVNALPMFYLNSLYPGAPWNVTHWGTKDPKANSLLRDAVAEQNEAKAKEKWHAVQELQFEEGGMLILANYNWLDGYGTSVRGAETTNAGLCNNFTYRTAWFES